jgi:hypothetical protein
MFAQASAATAAASSTAALPVSVRRNARSGVRRFCADVVARHTADDRDRVIDRFSATPVERTRTYCDVALRTYQKALLDELDACGVVGVLVDADGMIHWIDVHPDYTTRSEPAEILAAVDSLS